MTAYTVPPRRDLVSRVAREIDDFMSWMLYGSETWLVALLKGVPLLLFLYFVLGYIPNYAYTITTLYLGFSKDVGYLVGGRPGRRADLHAAPDPRPVDAGRPRAARLRLVADPLPRLPPVPGAGARDHPVHALQPRRRQPHPAALPAPGAGAWARSPPVAGRPGSPTCGSSTAASAAARRRPRPPPAPPGDPAASRSTAISRLLLVHLAWSLVIVAAAGGLIALELERHLSAGRPARLRRLRPGAAVRGGRAGLRGAPLRGRALRCPGLGERPSTARRGGWRGRARLVSPRGGRWACRWRPSSHSPSSRRSASMVR